MIINLLGIDIAKNVFQLHGIDVNGKAVLKKRLSRDKLAEYIANTPLCTIVMESCGGANYWARVFQRSGHTVKLISPQFVKPFVKTNKNDAEAITEAASRPSMHFVPIKQVEQQDIQSLHRIRSRLVKNRTALINEIRGLNLEYGITIPTGASKVKTKLCSILSNENNELTVASREFMNNLYNDLVEIEDKLKNLGKKVQQICRKNEDCRRIMKIPGVGELTATAMISAVPNPNVFKNGRHMSAWLGLVPRQHSNGEKQILLGISKRGDRYLRTLLIHGARAALSKYKNLDNKYGRWLTEKECTLSFNKAAVALANKNARVIWSILSTGNEFDLNNQKVAA
ncbi:IS110 family transposase [Photobacterium frigidiphilum]|uniref:IS110 family transposase n=1 Tax=Photobacterium frigidiphilum TaxID=264736 RepID=A0A2T3J5Z9_9GAMM|nr:IS110 family transposase [Photobacterium frigidiphilum]PSU42128.1 IS110 family transposase [Photobacterium frigidiphilum]